MTIESITSAAADTGLAQYLFVHLCTESRFSFEFIGLDNTFKVKASRSVYISTCFLERLLRKRLSVRSFSPETDYCLLESNKGETDTVSRKHGF